MMFFPLVNIIGYEFSVINGILFFLLSGIRAINNSKLNYEDNIAYHFRINKVFLLAAIFVPFILGLISTILFSECPFGEGVLFYFVISLPNLFFGYATGFCITAIFNRLRIFYFLIVSLLILLLPLVEFYFNPQVYFYNLIVGYFPGTIYDEDLAVNELLLSYRIFQISFFIFLIFLTDRVYKNKIRKIVFISILALTIVITYQLKPYFNYSTNMVRLEKNLTGKVETEHFDILYSDSIDKNAIMHLALLHEYYLEEINKKLEHKFKQRITSIVFRDENEKRILIGAGRADIAKPWLKQIYLNYPTYTETLKHEIVHVVASEFGTTPFKVADKINPAMIEGLAMAVEDDYDGFSVHHMAKLAYTTGYKVSMQNLFTGLNFMNHYSSIAYIYSGSFIKYLMDNYGVAKVKQLYGDINFSKIFGKSFDQLENEYIGYLNNVETEINKNRAQIYFGGKTIFKKHCVRTAAYKTKKAISLFGSGNYTKAEILFEDVYNYSGSYSAFVGLTNSRIKQKKFDLAEEYLSYEAPKFKDSPYKYNLELILGDLYVLNGKISSAISIYDSLLRQIPTLDYYNEVYVRKYLLNRDSSGLKNFILADRKGRFKILRNLADEKIVYETIPMMLYYCNDNDELKNLILFLKSRLTVFDRISAYASFRLSQAALKLGYYEIAKEIAVKSFELKNDVLLNHTFTENLKLINWLTNFSEETLKSISIE
jgi:hypothetical protein